METDYIPFPVPKQFVPEVTAFVARLLDEQGTPSRQSAVSDSIARMPAARVSREAASSNSQWSDGVVWTEGMFEALRADDHLVSQGRVLKILDTLTIGKESALPLEECAALAGLNDDEFRHALGWLTKFTKKHPKLWDESTWPFGWHKGYNPDRPGIFYYWMSEQQAAAWGR